MDVIVNSQSEDLSSGDDEIESERTADDGNEFGYEEKVDPSLHPTEEDVENIRKKLIESLKAENEMVERQKELYEEQRDLKIAIERAEADAKLLELQKTRERLKAQLEKVELDNASYHA